MFSISLIASYDQALLKLTGDMRYQKYRPASHLSALVECYFVWENQRPLGQPLRVESPPTGFTSIVFNVGDGYRVETGKGYRVVPQAFLTGQSTHRYELELTGRINMIGIVFRPTGLSTLFGLPQYELVDERIALTDVLGESGRILTDQLAETGNDADRVALLDGFLNRELRRRGNRFDRTDYAANLIVEQRGIVNVGTLMDELYVCRRQFERQFLQKVGVSPKYYARIRRIGYLCAQMAAQRWQVTDWHDLIYHCGYYDQSHFIRDFTQFTGKRPLVYLKDNIELTRHL